MYDLNCKKIIGESLDYEPWVTLSLSFNGIIYTEDSVSESRMLYSIKLDSDKKFWYTYVYLSHFTDAHTF